MLSLPGADHTIKFLKLIEFHCGVGPHKQLTNHCLQLGSVVQLPDTLLQCSGYTHTVVVGSALMRWGRLLVLAHA